MTAKKTLAQVLSVYFLAAYLFTLFNVFFYVRHIEYTGIATYAFAGVVWVVYGVIYILPAAAVTGLVSLVFGSRFAKRFIGEKGFRFAVYFTAAASMAAVSILLFADDTIYGMFGFHINGFVWNLITTKGGIESMGGDSSTSATYAAFLAGIVAVHVGMLFASRTNLIQNKFGDILNAKRAVITVVLAAVLFLAQGITYGVSKFYFYSPVLMAAGVFPGYIPISFSKAAQRVGMKMPKSDAVAIRSGSSKLKYPLKPMVIDKQAKKYNVVWLAAESLRWDMVDVNIMPATYKFANTAIWCRNNFSGGNGTRMGMFSLFYGLYGSYWFGFLAENRGPVLIDALIEQNYQMDMRTSAAFSYPEFDKTVFARVPSKNMHDGLKGFSWERDRENVGALLKFIDSRDPNRPFMTFMFFESSHAPYDFPPENVIRKDYLKEMNYARLDLVHQIGQIKNRYINSCNHLDGQIARILEYLKKHDLLDSTIVVMSGDHGQEFMEHGKWGHNSAFVEEQMRAPLILWIPGQRARQITSMTSHMDVSATIGKLLGIKNDPGDYSQGINLLGGTKRDFTIVSDWDTMAYVGQKYRAIFPTQATSLVRQVVTDGNDVEIRDSGTFFRNHKAQLAAIMKALGVFRVKKG